MDDESILQRGAIVCSDVATHASPILYAERSEPEDEADSGWQFSCGRSSDDWRAAEVWAIHEVLEHDKSLLPLVELPVGTVLSRDSSGDEWHVQRR
jgi:hypothetical protein